MVTFEVRPEKQEGGNTLQAGGMADAKGPRGKRVWHLQREKRQSGWRMGAGLRVMSGLSESLKGGHVM